MIKEGSNVPRKGHTQKRDVLADPIYNNKVVTVNGADCYVFSCSGKTFAVAVKLSAVYYAHNGEYQPLTFNNTNYLFK